MIRPVEGKIRTWVTIVYPMAFLILVGAWGIWKYQYTNKPKLPVINLQITTNSPPAGTSLLPEQRRKFALEFGKKLKDKGMNTTVTTTGDYHTSILIQGSIVNEPLVNEMKDNTTAINQLRGAGFKHLIMTNDQLVWDVDLKN